MLSSDEQKRVVEAVEGWARSHPAPNSPALQLGSGEILTPHEAAQAVARGFSDTNGARILQLVEYGRKFVPLDEIIKDFTSPGRAKGDSHGVHHARGSGK